MKKSGTYRVNYLSGYRVRKPLCIVFLLSFNLLVAGHKELDHTPGKKI